MSGAARLTAWRNSIKLSHDLHGQSVYASKSQKTKEKSEVHNSSWDILFFIIKIVYLSTIESIKNTQKHPYKILSIHSYPNWVSLNLVDDSPLSEVQYLSRRIRSRGRSLIGGGVYGAAISLADIGTRRRDEWAERAMLSQTATFLNTLSVRRVALTTSKEVDHRFLVYFFTTRMVIACLL